MASYQSTKMNPKKFHYSQLKFYAILIPLATIMILPLLYVLLSAFKPLEEMFKFPPRIFPRKPTLENFRMIFNIIDSASVPVPRYIFNTIIVTVAIMVGSIVFSVFAGYVLSKSKAKATKAMLQINNIALMFVSIAVTIPRYIIIVRIGLYDNFLANILPLVAVPVGLFLLKQFIDQIPDALIESARIDGASEARIVFTIIFPLLKPPIATVMVLSFQAGWGNQEASNMFIDNESLKTFSYFMTTFAAGNMGIAGTGAVAASSFLMFLPNLIIFIVMQSRVMATMAHSGIK